MPTLASCSLALLTPLVSCHCLSQSRELWQSFMLTRSASKRWSLQNCKLQFLSRFMSTTECCFPRSHHLQVEKKSGLPNLQLLVTMHGNRGKPAWCAELGWNLQEGYHTENLIQKTLGKLAPNKQLLSEYELAHTANQVAPRAAGRLIPRTIAAALWQKLCSLMNL